MEKLLLIGIDTRSMLNSALDLEYEIFSASYFSTSDTPTIKNQKIVLKESDGESCGSFEENFDPKYILEFSRDFIDEVDYIIPISGVSPSDFKKNDKKKILGNKDVGELENKFKFYEEIKDEFLTPMTFKLNDIDEALEINKNYPNNQFIIKPLQGSGGYDVNLLNNDSDFEFKDDEYIMQEYIKGINLSSSVLSNTTTAKNITNSRLLTMNDFKNNNDFRYVGNILPLTKKSVMTPVNNFDKLKREMKTTSENLIKKFNLIGSNGVDFILNEDGLNIIEVNPRIQGTFECVEKTFGVNMLEAHIKACQGELINIPEAKYYSYKKIIYSPTRMKYHKMNLNNIYDLPHIGSITEINEPLLTIIEKDKSFENLCKKVELTDKIVNEESRKGQLDE
ncbi:MAG: ATP-grasp domain-containing protein [Methanobrevibacter sp.]|uniref:ATP-grasp domain-containing protein n=1 Tax=Methanobrevibacter sp. TaxID=66852 RepID=UPI0025FF3ACB|nr:ATP-grasp domain-containing protein [Methanobrevibacter sp.]MBQ8017638.1 ATP-grasp domain-containing protein [Methanobrevibacter sp.]MBR1611360.1 ATP-grasp domain-containing protein [Methanobrevibacter sp.]